MLSTLLMLNSLNQQAAQRNTDVKGEIAGLMMLASMLNANGTAATPTPPQPPHPPKNPERTRIQRLTLKDFICEHYLPERNHEQKSATAELSAELLTQLQWAFGRKIFVKELNVGTLRQFRDWLKGRMQGRVQGPSKRKIVGATANRHLRQFRVIWNHAARWQWSDVGKRWRVIKPPPPIDFFPEEDPEVDAWDEDQLSAIEEQARKLIGNLPKKGSRRTDWPDTVPLATFWTAWALVLRSVGCRITAMMLARREDYDQETKSILLRRENQKQKKDQRIALPPRAAAAVEKLLAAHDGELIFGCWPYDPVMKSTVRRKWPALTKHFEKLLVRPAGLSLATNVKTRQFRRTAATIVEERGGNAQELLGHSDRKTTERYKDRKRQPICRQSLLIPDGKHPQKTLF